MIEALILSYHSLPLNVIASYRANALLEHFPENGIRPTLITQNWNQPELQNSEIKDQYCIHFLPEIKDKSKNWFFGGKIGLVIRWLKGFFDDYPGAIDNYNYYREFTSNLLKTTKFDIIIAIYSPHHHLKLAHYLSGRFGIPCVMDFRDLWDNRIVSDHFEPSFPLSLKYFLIRKYWRKWIGRALFFTSISKPWVQYLEKISSINGYVISHGYEEDILEVRESPEHPEAFNMMYTGTVNRAQNIEMLGEGVSKFLSLHPGIDFKVSFIGSKRKSNHEQFIDPEPILKKYLHSRYFEVTVRKSRIEMLHKIRQSSLLFLPTYKGYEGTYSGKLFEYLGSGKNIVVFPSDHSVIEELIHKTETGVVLNSADELCDYLDLKYTEFQELGYCLYGAKEDIVAMYSRQNQTKQFADLVKMYIN